jgi:hypothetical protein
MEIRSFTGKLLYMLKFEITLHCIQPQVEAQFLSACPPPFIFNYYLPLIS